MKDQWTDRLSEYLDGGLGAAERAALEGHLATCVECVATLGELRRVVARARALDDRPPTADLWPAIAEQIGVVSLATRRARRVSFTVPQLAAASVTLALLSSATAWLLVRPGAPPAPVATSPTPPPASPPKLVTAAMYPDKRYSAQVADLERTLQRDRGRLDTATVRVIEKNLRIIDRAIRDAQSALAADPANSYLNLHLAQEMRRKLELLRQAAALAGAPS
jgi:putative zinc finger protein